MPQCSQSSVRTPSRLLAEPRLTTETAIGIMSYALYTYHWRAQSIRKGGRGPYDDRLGPVSTLRRFAHQANFITHGSRHSFAPLFWVCFFMPPTEFVLTHPQCPLSSTLFSGSRKDNSPLWLLISPLFTPCIPRSTSSTAWLSGLAAE